MKDAPDLPFGYRAHLFDEVGSTNAVAFEAAAAGEPGGLWIVARRQTAGRGRQGRAWVSEPGNLFASLMLRDPAPAPHLGELPLVAAVAVHDAVADVLPPNARPELQLKWPNDLLLGGAKLSGMLIEGASQPEGRVVVVGIGVNCVRHPADTPYPATDLAACGFDVAAGDLFVHLARRIARRLGEWQGGAFASIREAWLARARGIGQPVTVRMPDETVEGILAGLDEGGRLLLRGPAGTLRSISAGDVFFPRRPAVSSRG